MSYDRHMAPPLLPIALGLLTVTAAAVAVGSHARSKASRAPSRTTTKGARTPIATKAPTGRPGAAQAQALVPNVAAPRFALHGPGYCPSEADDWKGARMVAPLVGGPCKPGEQSSAPGCVASYCLPSEGIWWNQEWQPWNAHGTRTKVLSRKTIPNVLQSWPTHGASSPPANVIKEALVLIGVLTDTYGPEAAGHYEIVRESPVGGGWMSKTTSAGKGWVWRYDATPWSGHVVILGMGTRPRLPGEPPDPFGGMHNVYGVLDDAAFAALLVKQAESWAKSFGIEKLGFEFMFSLLSALGGVILAGAPAVATLIAELANKGGTALAQFLATLPEWIQQLIPSAVSSGIQTLIALTPEVAAQLPSAAVVAAKFKP